MFCGICDRVAAMPKRYRRSQPPQIRLLGARSPCIPNGLLAYLARNHILCHVKKISF
ncbi:hypothetical protein [Microcoleus sp. T2B6]|uniref:hypothetical protein n=1 Tax=Microcoleus sp. T2B6 TaxID=3055424 RepID=UPI002FD67CDD